MRSDIFDPVLQGPDVMTFDELQQFGLSPRNIRLVQNIRLSDIFNLIRHLDHYDGSGKKVSMEEKIQDIINDGPVKIKSIRHAYVVLYLQSLVKIENINHHLDHRIKKKSGVDHTIPAGDNDDNDEFDDLNVGGYQQYYDAIKDGRFVDLYHDGHRVPGHLHSYKSCGHYITKSCLDRPEHTALGHPKVIPLVKVPFQCGRISCQTCFSASIQKMAMEITNRMWSYALFKKSKLHANRRERIFNHIVVSIPSSDWPLLNHPSGVRKLREKMIRMLEDVGITGGIQITHLWRFIRNLESGYFSPHVHVIGLGWIDALKVKANYDNTKYIIKKLSDFRTHGDLFNVSRYLLSHSSVQEKKHTVRYFGEAHNTKFRSLSLRTKSVSSLDELEGIFSDFKRVDDIDLEILCNGSDDNNIRDYVSDGTLSFDSIDALKKYERDNITYPVHDHDGHVCKENPAKPPSVQSPLLYTGTPEYETSDYYHIIRLKITKSTWNKKTGKYVSKKSERVIILELDPSLADLCPICSAFMRPVVPINDNTEELGRFLGDIDPSTVVLIDDLDEWEYRDYFNMDPRGIFYVTLDGAVEYDDKIPQKSKWYSDLLWEEKYQFMADDALAKAQRTKLMNVGKHLTADERDELLNNYVDLVWDKTIRAINQTNIIIPQTTTSQKITQFSSS